MPGSPFSHADDTMRSNTSRAGRAPARSPDRGLTRSMSFPVRTASMKDSVSPTEMLKLFSFRLSFLQEMKSRMSGWCTDRTPMLAPRRIPPCLIVSVAASNTVMNEMGPLEIPLVEHTSSLRGRIREKENPVPPPLLWISAVFLMASKMLSMESPTGSTKQAESWPSLRPAFMRVGEFGSISMRVISGKKRSCQAFTASSPPSFRSASATERATRRNMSTGLSRGLPWRSFLRYLRSSTRSAFSPRGATASSPRGPWTASAAASPPSNDSPAPGPAALSSGFSERTVPISLPSSRCQIADYVILCTLLIRIQDMV